MDTDEIMYLRELVEVHTKRLRILTLTRANYGIACPAHIQIEIESIQAEIDILEQQISEGSSQPPLSEEEPPTEVESSHPIPLPEPDLVSTPHQSATSLCRRISKRNLWLTLQKICVETAIAGGMAAMGFYHGAWQSPIILSGKVKNPSTLADVQATSRILQTAHPLLAPIARRLNCGLSYLGEETERKTELRDRLSDDIFQRIQDPPDFFDDSQEHGLRLILDGIDGTGGFIRGIPLFCSAVAILVADQVRISAIYDPIHQVVYSALLLGEYENPEEKTEAWVWQVATGNRSNLAELALKEEKRELIAEAIGIHLTRSHPGILRVFLETRVSSEELCRFLERHPSSEELRKFFETHRFSEELREFLDTYPSVEELRNFLATRPSPEGSMLERLAGESGGIYALGSGTEAMVDVARGALGGFVNIITNLWDIAPGEVLVRACGGKVTGFDGVPIAYSSPDRVSIIAAKAHLHPKIREIVEYSQ